MARFKYAHNNFGSGELSPQSQSRYDLDQQKQGLSICENFLTSSTGGLERRMGSNFAYALSDANGGKLVPFVYSKTESYMIVFTDDTIEIINADSKEVLTTSSGITKASDVILPGVGLNDPKIETIQYAQSADRLWVTYEKHPPIIISRTAEDTFTVKRYDDSSLYADNDELAKGIPWRDANITSETMTIDTATVGTGRTLTSSLGASRYFFTGEYFQVYDTGTSTTGLCKVTADGAGSCTVTVIIAFGSTNSFSTWTRSAWGGDNSSTETGKSDYPGYPKAVCFFEGRLIYGGSNLFPDTLWGSESFNYFRMMTNAAAFTEWTLADELQTGNAGALSIEIASQEVNAIQWMVPKGKLSIGTLGSEFIASGLSETGFGPSSYTITRQTNYGSSAVQGVLANDLVVFVQRTGRQVRGFIFDDNQQSYKSDQLNSFSDHFVPFKTEEFHPIATFGNTSSRVKIQIKDMAYHPSNDTVWCCDNAGGLFSGTINRLTNSVSWNYHLISGTYTRFSTDDDYAYVRSVAVTPTYDSSNDLIWIMVTRTINGTNVSYVEYINGKFLNEDITTTSFNGVTAYQEDEPVFTDSARYQSIPSSEVSFDISDVDTGTDTIDQPTSTLFDGMKVLYEETNGAIDDLTDGEYYYVVGATNAEFQLALTPGGSAINFTSTTDGAGDDFTLTPQPSTVFGLVSGDSSYGFSHLEGETVKVLADNAYVGEYVVSSGQITLTKAYSKIIAGLAYKSRLKTIRLEAGSIFGLAQNDIKKIDQVTIDFYRTISASYARNESETLTPFEFRPVDLAMNLPIPLFTGRKTVEFPPGYDRDAYVYIETDLPLPLGISSIICRGETYD